MCAADAQQHSLIFSTCIKGTIIVALPSGSISHVYEQMVPHTAGLYVASLPDCCQVYCSSLLLKLFVVFLQIRSPIRCVI